MTFHEISEIVNNLFPMAALIAIMVFHWRSVSSERAANEADRRANEDRIKTILMAASKGNPD